MHLELVQYVIAAGCGAAIGFTLGLIGGGGSVLAVPLLVYVVGVKDPHVAIGTSAFAVAVNAAFSLWNHAPHRLGEMALRRHLRRGRNGRRHCRLDDRQGFDGQRLLFLFALAMIMTGVMMLRGRGSPGDAAVECTRGPRAAASPPSDSSTGLFSGFFGIGGGVLVVPGLVGSTGMPHDQRRRHVARRRHCLRLTTAVNYAARASSIGRSLSSCSSAAPRHDVRRRLARRLAKKTGRLTTLSRSSSSPSPPIRWRTRLSSDRSCRAQRRRAGVGPARSADRRRASASRWSRDMGFYELSEEERIELTRKAMAERRTVIERWSARTDRKPRPGASARPRRPSSVGCASVADLGCGTMTLKSHLAPGTRYVPVDVVARDADTVVVDLNREPLPALAVRERPRSACWNICSMFPSCSGGCRASS